MVADVTIGSFDWSENGILRELKELQENGAFADLSFTCSDGLVLDAHQTVIERHSALLKKFSRSTQCCACGGKDHSDFRLGQLAVVLPDVTSDTMETLLRLLYVGEATVDGEGAATELLDACRMLGIALPSEITTTLRETSKERSEIPSVPKIRLKSVAELMSPSKVGPSPSLELGAQKSRLECPDCRRSFPLQFALNKHMEKGCQSVEVTIEVNPFPGTPVNLEVIFVTLESALNDFGGNMHVPSTVLCDIFTFFIATLKFAAGSRGRHECGRGRANDSGRVAGPAPCPADAVAPAGDQNHPPDRHAECHSERPTAIFQRPRTTSQNPRRHLLAAVSRRGAKRV